jgi:hypothetical protein
MHLASNLSSTNAAAQLAWNAGSRLFAVSIAPIQAAEASSARLFGQDIELHCQWGRARTLTLFAHLRKFIAGGKLAEQKIRIPDHQGVYLVRVGYAAFSPIADQATSPRWPTRS